MTVPPFALAVAKHRLTKPGFARVATAALVNPQRAMEYGYLDDVVPEAKLDSVANDVLSGFSRLDMPSYVATKQAINRQVIEEVKASQSMFA